MNERDVMLLHETVWQSVARDITSAVMVVGLIGSGVWVGSTAMQWLGFILFWLVLLVRANSKIRYTPQQAADYLKERYGVTAR